MERERDDIATADEEREIYNRLLIAIRERMSQEQVQEDDLLATPAAHLGE